MAIVVPFLVQAGVTAMGYAATTAAIAATVTSVAFQVTGVNDKINKAASKVFGEDLVMIANIAGAVYGAVNGGFSLGGADTAAATADAATSFVNGSDVADDLFHAVGGMSSDGLQALSSTSDPSSLFATNGLDAADNAFSLKNAAAGGGLASDGLGVAATGPAATNGADLMGADPSIGKDMKAPGDLTKTAESMGPARSGAAQPNAAGTNAAANQPGQQLKAGDVTKGVQGPKTLDVTKPVAAELGSFFDKLGKFATSDKGIGMLVQGVGTGLTNASKEKLEKERMAVADQRYHSVSGIRVT